MPTSRLPRLIRRFGLPHAIVCLVFVSASGALAPSAGAKAKRSSLAPDGVCYPVNGKGYMVARADGSKVPLGTLSPLVEGDSLVVTAGTITFVDFRTGQTPIYGAGSRLQIPPVKKPKRPGWWKRLEDHVMRSLSDPERDRIGGSVRGAEAAFWPDSARFGMRIGIVFQWSGVHPPPASLRVCSGADTTEFALSQGRRPSGAFEWRPARPEQGGRVTWWLLDAEMERLGGGWFEILSPEATAAERERFRAAASALGGEQPLELASALLAQADRAYLW